jgi:hypothetical protein
MSRSIAKYMNLEKSKRPTFWNGRSSSTVQYKHSPHIIFQLLRAYACSFCPHHLLYLSFTFLPLSHWNSVNVTCLMMINRACHWLRIERPWESIFHSVSASDSMPPWFRTHSRRGDAPLNEEQLTLRKPKQQRGSRPLEKHASVQEEVIGKPKDCFSEGLCLDRIRLFFQQVLIYCSFSE